MGLLSAPVLFAALLTAGVALALRDPEQLMWIKVRGHAVFHSGYSVYCARNG
jgi:hypothetical protein